MNKVCPACLKKNHLTNHHVYPLRFFKHSRVTIPLCRSCHDDIEKMIPRYEKLTRDEYMILTMNFLISKWNSWCPSMARDEGLSLPATLVGSIFFVIIYLLGFYDTDLGFLRWGRQRILNRHIPSYVCVWFYTTMYRRYRPPSLHFYKDRIYFKYVITLREKQAP